VLTLQQASCCQYDAAGAPSHKLWHLSLVTSGSIDSAKRRRNVYDKKPQRYAKVNRTAHLTARSDKSLAYVTKNKRLYSTFCTVEANYWQTRSIARPLCDNRATCCFSYFTLNNILTLKTWLGVVRSLKMAPFNKTYTTFCWSAIVNIAISCTVLSYLTLNDVMTLKSGLEVTQCHWVIQTGTIRKLWCGFLFALVTKVLSCIICETKRYISRMS